MQIDDVFEKWLRSVCFQKPTPEAYDLAKCAWREAMQLVNAEVVFEHIKHGDQEHQRWLLEKLRELLPHNAAVTIPH